MGEARMGWIGCSAAVLALTAVGTGCTRTDQVESTGTASTTEATTSAPTTSAPATTQPAPTQPSTTAAPTSAPSTVPPTTEPSATTGAATTLPPATVPSTVPATTVDAGPLALADLVLRADGIGPLDYGDTDDDVIIGLTQALGQAADDRPATYPIAYGELFLTEDDDTYVAPFGRTVCYTNDLCVQFGGPDTERLTFTGWSLQSDHEPQLFTATGVTMGSIWAEVSDAITVAPFACYSYGYGDADGVQVGLLSIGEPFSIPNEDGSTTQGNPDPADVTVVSVEAGRLPGYLYDDC